MQLLTTMVQFQEGPSFKLAEQKPENSSDVPQNIRGRAAPGTQSYAQRRYPSCLPEAI